MRLLTLDLERFGPFTDKRLTFRPDARLHVVHGRNEAGKSCSLAGVTDLLFGIERTTRFDWLHPGKELRLGATLRNREGAEFQFRRRKNKPVLSNASDVALPDDALAPFLGGLSREVFRRAFGLDAEALRKSAEDLRHTDGELGAALFSAASGLRGVSDAKAALEEEADAIFAERKAKDRTFYQALARFEDARKLLREHETRAGDLKALREQVIAHEHKRRDIRERRAAIASEQARLARLKRATPILRAIDDEEARLGALGELPAAVPGIGAKLVAALAALAGAQTTQDDAEKRLERLSAALEAAAVDEALLDRADDVERLRTDLGEYRKGTRDLPGVDRELEAAARELAGLAARLGIAPAELVARQPDDASRALLADLAAQGRALHAALDAKIVDRDVQNAALASKRQERGQRGALRDPHSLRESRAALAGILRLAEQAAELAPALDADAAALARDGLKLEPAVTDLARLASAGMPGQEAIATTAASLALLDAALRDAGLAREAAATEGTSLQSVLHDLASGGPVPTPELIAERRAERDRMWGTLSAALFGEQDAPSAGALPGAVAAFERTKAEADRLSDDAARDAQRVAAHADATRRLGRATAAMTTQAAEIDALERRRDVLLDDWRTRWAAVGIEPTAPSAMAGWRLRVEDLFARLARLDERRLALRRIEDELADARPAFDALVADLGLAPSPGLTIPTLAQRIDVEIDRVAKAWDDARDLDTLLAELERRTAEADKAAAKAADALEIWRETFRSALPRIGLTGDASYAEAEAILNAWKDVPKAKAVHDGLVRRVAGLKRDGAHFEASVAALAETIAPDLAGHDPESVLRVVNQRLTAAREARARRGEALAQLSEAQLAAERAGEVYEGSAENVRALAQALGAEVDETLGALARQLEERDAHVASLTARREELGRTAEGVAEAALRDDLRDWDPDQAASRQAALADEDGELDHQADEASALLQQAKARLDALEDAVEAEVALQQRRNAEAEMVEAAREWAVLRVGAAMMGAAIARQRIGRQEPLMSRAGELFAILTGGSFEGLGQSYDDDDVPRLVGRRPGGQECAVHALSEGSRDQLYLALRLAYVEDYASRSEPPPFIGDDLFASFDDGRTAHGLRALAAIGETVQPILFTHHGFLVEAARRELGEQVDVIELGD